MSPEAGYYRHPTIHGDRLVFACEDDLWTVSTEGGVARRLTANPGHVSSPVFSPDGSKIAFTGQDEGPSEVYVMDAEGGEPQRLSWLGAFTHTVGWRPDGKSVLLATSWRQMSMGLLHLAELPVEGGAPKSLDLGPARAIAFQPGGKGVVLGRNAWDPARWKRYRGGTAGTLWIDRQGNGSFVPLIELEGNLAGPMWIGSRVYFLSDHEGHGNLYSVTPTGRGLRRHTNHEDFYARFPSTDGSRVAYHAGGDLWVFDPEQDETQRLDVRIRSPRTARKRRFVDAPRFLESFSLHPEGHSATVISRGGAFSFGLWDGPVIRHGDVSSERRRLATWLSDGKRIVSTSDRKGEESLVLGSAAGTGRVRELANDLGRVLEIEPSPAGSERVAVTNHRQELWLVDVARRTKRRVDVSGYERIEGLAWSPDGRWLAYSLPVSPQARSIRVFDTQTWKKHAVTGSDFVDVSPTFDPEGRYLYFVSWRVFDPVYDSHYFDLGFPRGARPYLVTLRKDDPSPFESATREPRPPTGVNGDLEKMLQAKKPKVPKVRIDFAGIEQRVVPFPVPEARYARIKGAAGRALFSAWPILGSLGADDPPGSPPAARGKLQAWDFEAEKVETLLEGITDFDTSADGRALGIRIGNRLRVVSAGAKPPELAAKGKSGRAGGWTDLERIRLEVLPGAEWRQMFSEAWRLQRDHFWTPDMSGIEWQKIHDRYLPLVDRVASRAEFSDLVWEMQGELGTSHCYEMGGDYRPVPPWHQGFLGADLEYRARTRSWHVGAIPQGDGWDAGHASPLAAPGVGVRKGDRIEAVDGVAVGARRSPYECLVNRAGQPVRLTVRSGNAKPRTVVVRAAPQEYGLRYRDWVEANRAWIHEKSKGKVGYIHVPDMGPRGFSEFHRYYQQEVEHLGLVVDVRFNGGGHVSQLLLEKLLRRRIGYDQTRWNKRPMSYPDAAPMGPMVALTNEYAGSDGDIFSQAFKLYGLGPLIGQRTWGGVVGIWPRHALVDGTVTSQPEFSFWFLDVGWGVENYGVAPDIEVVIRPQDYKAGVDPQLERSLKEVLAIIRREKPSLPDFGKRPVLKAPKLPKA